MIALTQATTAGWWRGRAAQPAAPVVRPARPTGVVAFRALLAFLFILVLAPQAFMPALQPFRLAFVTASVAIIAYLVQRIVHRQPLVDLDREIRVTGLLVMWAALTIPFAIWVGGAVEFFAGKYLKSVALFLLLAHVVDSRERMVKVAWLLALVAVPLALTGIRNYLSGSFHGDRVIGYEGGLTTNPNDLALMLNLLLPFVLALFLGARKAMAKAFFAAASGLVVLGIVVTFSRSGFLALMLVGTIYVATLLRRRRYGPVLVAAFMAFAALPFLPASYIDRIATIASVESDETGSSQQRWEDNKDALRYIAANPLTGAGIGQSALAMNEIRGERWLHVHNIYLETAVDLGIPGLALFAMLIFGFTGAAHQARRRAAAHGGDPRFFHVVEAVWVALITFAVIGVFYPASYQFYLYLFAGLALAARSITLREAR